MTVELGNFYNFWATLSAAWILFRRIANSALSSRSELITRSNRVSYSWHREAFSPRLCFTAAALESEGCLPSAFLDYRLSLSFVSSGNNSSGLSPCQLISAWAASQSRADFLDDCSAKQIINSSCCLKPRVSGYLAGSAAEVGAPRCPSVLQALQLPEEVCSDLLTSSASEQSGIRHIYSI